jgi:dTMP kinase
MAGLLISFSGIDGAGKSTQIGLLLNHLQRAGKKPIYIWSRGGYTPLFETVKTLLRRFFGRLMPPSGKNPQRTKVLTKPWMSRLWLFLALVDMIWLYGLKIRWLRWRGEVLVNDRYLDDTMIDFRLNFPQMNIKNWWLWKGLSLMSPKPDIAFLLLIPVEESIRRSDLKGEPFKDSPDVLAQRLWYYQSLAQTGNWRSLDGLRPVPELFKEIEALVNQRIVFKSGMHLKEI